MLLFFRKEGLASFRLLLLALTLLSAGCIAPDVLLYPPPENAARVLGFPVTVMQPLAPDNGNAWPAPSARPQTMLDLRASKVSTRPSAAAASRGDFGMCLPSAPHLDSRGRISTAPPGVPLGVC